MSAWTNRCRYLRRVLSPMLATSASTFSGPPCPRAYMQTATLKKVGHVQPLVRLLEAPCPCAQHQVRALAGLVQHTVSQLLDEVVQTLFAASEILLARALITVQVALDGGSTPPAERTSDVAAGATIRGQHRGDNRHGLLLALDQEPLELPARTLLHGRTRLPDSTQRAHHHDNPLLPGANHRCQLDVGCWRARGRRRTILS